MNHLYYNMVCKVVLANNVEIVYVNNITINSSIKMLEDKATITIPREYFNFQGENIRKYINVDDSIEIYLGYEVDGVEDMELEFEGYITKIGADVPLVIECEDEMWWLRKSNYTKAFKSLTLEQLVKYIAPNYQYDLIDKVTLGKFTIENESAYKVLTRLRKDYGLHGRFVGKTLTVGFPVSFKPDIAHEINLNRNVRALQQQKDLKFVSKEDLKILLKAISISSSDGSRIYEEYGDKNGAVRTLHFLNKSKSELKDLVEKNYKSLNFDGYEGSIPTWGTPRTKAGESVQITDPNYMNSERDGKYLIEGVEIKFNSSDGFKRINKLSLKI